MTPQVIAVVGATATGKSDLALDLAEELGGEVVNADAMQLYRGMDIGTNKLPPDERRGIPHHILDVLDVPCVCSQVLTHEWDGRTQSYRQRWTVPEHFPSCVKHWPATTGAPPAGTVAGRRHEGGPLVTPAARVAAERERSRAERQPLPGPDDADYTIARAVDAWARQVTDRAPMSRGAIDAWERQITGHPPAPQTRELPSGVTFEPYPARRTPGGVPYRAPAAITTYGVPADCTCVPAHAHAALANTHVLHRADCATNRGTHTAEWRPMGNNG